MASDNIVIVDLFKDVVNSMRESSTITSFSDVNGRYTLTTKNNLKDNDVVTIENVDYLVASPIETQFEIDADTGLDFNNKTWVAKAPYYMHGHPIEIVNRLNKKNKGGIYSYQKYPLIALFQDFEETIDSELVNYASISPTLIIANLTRPEIDASDRYDRNFRDILYPIYYDLLDKLYKNRSFNIRHPMAISHTKIDRLYWGTQGGQGNEANLHDEYIDAIEINFSDLNILETRCKNINYGI